MYTQEEMVGVAIAALREQMVYTEDWEGIIPKNNSQRLAKMVLIEYDKVGLFFQQQIKEEEKSK